MEKFSETSAGLTRDGSMLGTPLYMSPEQAKGAPNIDVRSDVWSLGIVLYELLSGALPYADANSLGELMVAIITADLPLIQDKAPWVPPELAEITHKAISRDINRRFQNAGELRDALAAIVPDGARITPDMLQGIDPNHRQYVAPRLQMTDDGMLRATTRTGLAVTAMSPPKKKSNAGVIAAVAAAGVLVLGGVGAAVALSKKSQTEATSASRPEPPPIIKSVIVTERVQAEVEKKTFDLIVTAPPETTITIDDQPASLSGDKLSITGTPGATRHVKLTLGDQVQEQTIAVTEGGLLPPRLELKKQAATPARPAGGGAAAPGKPGADKQAATPAKPADAPKPKKPQVETGMDEFK
jgi:serine/threonine-protein kinase